ncbi:hypothetical protein PybrP1_011388 [[Pythium] brassicae (nom. inval.)]|nr:hypothetical protein PybrP1_011388 [[Pythium] brassicae (nom. inval.)]
MTDSDTPAGLVRRAPPARARSMSASALSSAAPPVLSFKELQRLHAMQMEFFGFAGWLASALLYVLYLAWAYLPDATLEAYGLAFLPNKRWALALPALLVVTYLFSIALYKALSLLTTPPLASYATVLDAHSVFLPDAPDAHADAATPPIGDLPIFAVNHLMLTQKLR